MQSQKPAIEKEGNSLMPTMLLLGTLPILIGTVLFGVAIARSGFLPKLAGIGLALGGVVFPVTAIFFDNFIESVGVVLLVASVV